MDREAALNRARKYLSLARQKDSPHEAATADVRLKKLMKEHGFKLADITDVQPTDVGEWDAPGLFNAAWRLSVLTFTGQVYGCKAIRIMESEKDERFSRPVQNWYGRLIGRRSDADCALYAFSYYERAAMELSNKHGFDVASASDEDSFLRGIAYGVYKRVEEQTRNLPKKEVPLPPTATAVVTTEKTDTDAAKRYLDSKYAVRDKKASTGQAANYDVFYIGYSASRSIRLISPDSAAVAGLIAEEKKKTETPGAADAKSAG